MPTRETAFDFEDKPSGSDDKLPRIPRRGDKRNNFASIVTMMGNTKADKAKGDKAARMNRSTTRNQIKRAQASKNDAPNSEDEIKQPSEDGIKQPSEDEKTRERQKHEREARKQRMNDKSAHQQRADDFVASCTDDVLVDRLLEKTPGGKVHGPWDANMSRQEVARGGSCFIHAALRCSGYDPHEDKDGDVYKAKVSTLRKEIHAYLVDHADCMSWTKDCDHRTQRGRNSVQVGTYGDYCEHMEKDGTYMGDLEIQAFCNMRNVAFQVATDKVVHDDNADGVGAPPTGLGMMFQPCQILDQKIMESNHVDTYHILHRGCGHFEPCIRTDRVSDPIIPDEPSVQNERIDIEPGDGEAEAENGAKQDLFEACHVQIDDDLFHVPQQPAEPPRNVEAVQQAAQQSRDDQPVEQCKPEASAREAQSPSQQVPAAQINAGRGQAEDDHDGQQHGDDEPAEAAQQSSPQQVPVGPDAWIEEHVDENGRYRRDQIYQDNCYYWLITADWGTVNLNKVYILYG